MSHARIAGLGLALVAFAQLASPASGQVILPQELEELNQLHIEFRWEPLDDALGGYMIIVVEDNGAPDPFLSNRTLRFFSSPGFEPRRIVKRNLEFGKSYAWRVTGFAGTPPTGQVGPTHRFSTAPLPNNLSPIKIQTFPVAGEQQPGLTLFNLRRNTGNEGLILGVEHSGRIVYFREFPGGIADVRMNQRGRITLGFTPTVLNGPDGNGAEVTLDGKLIWLSPPGTDQHHETFEMANGNKLILTREIQSHPFPFPGGVATDYRGDRIVELDWHTKEELWSWSVFDAYSLGDLGLNSFDMMPYSPADWTHGNAAVYNPLDGDVYYSSRNLSRITRIDRGTGNIVYNMGDEDLPAGDVSFGDNLFSNQHAPQLLPNGNMIVYDNGNLIEPLTNPRQSRAIELAFAGPRNDPTDVQIVWEYRVEGNGASPIFTAFVGDADRLPNGNTLVTVGRAAILDEVNAAAELMWRLIISPPFPNNLIYRSERIASLVLDTPHDSDGDSDVDIADLLELQVAYTDTGASGLEFPDRLLDHDGDDDIDAVDLEELVYWMTGPGQ